MAEKEKDPKELTDKDYAEKFGLVMTSVADITEAQTLILTGLVGWDYLVGGLWSGHIHIIQGAERSGKSSLLYSIIKKLIDIYDFKIGLVDVEGSVDETFMSALGLYESPNLTIIHVIGGGEQALQGINKVILSKKFNVVAIDSFAAFVPSQIMSSDAAGQYARMMSRYMAGINQSALATNTIIIGTNQRRIDLSGFHPSNTSVGGNALKHYSSTRIDIAAKEKEEYFQYSLAKCIKSKNHKPNRELTFKIYFGKGIDEGHDKIEVGLLIKQIKEVGGWLEYNGKRYRRAELELLLAHESPPWTQEILDSEAAPLEEQMPTQMLSFTKKEPGEPEVTPATKETKKKEKSNGK